MIFTYLSILVLVLLAILFLFLTRRAMRLKHPLKWFSVFLTGLLSLVFILSVGLAAMGVSKGRAEHDIPVPEIQVAGTPEQIARGQYLANTFCTSCHSLNGELPLTGGVDLGEDLALPLGSFVSANLTPAGPLAGWSDGEIFRALRNGVGQDGRWLVLMSSVRARNMSDEDIMAIIAYLRNQPGVTHEIPEPLDRPNLLGMIMSGAGLVPEGPPPILGTILAPPKAATATYGEYIFSYQDCRDCHGEALHGGMQGQLAPIGSTLLGTKFWTTDEFITAMRTGVVPGGDTIDPPMPWQSIGRMDDEELTAMHLYLQTLQ